MFEKAKAYVAQQKEKAKEGIRKTVNWMAANKEITVAAIIGTYKLGNKALRYLNSRKQYDLRSRSYYDPRTHRWEETDRKLRNWEYDELAYRQARGEYVRDILKDMGRLK